MNEHKDRDWLFDKYHKDNLSCAEIGKISGVSGACVCQWIHRLNIPNKTNAETLLKEKYAPSLITYRSKEWLLKKYLDERLSLENIGILCGVTGSAIYRWMKKFSIPCRTYLENNSGDHSPNIGRKHSAETKRKRSAYLAANPDAIYRGPCHVLYTNGHGRHFPYLGEFGEKLKTDIKNRDEYTCQLCGAVEGEKKHHVHHIDYKIENNAPANLITLCPRHNVQANYGRDKWQFFFETYQEIRAI
jgi:predicted DNA-binding protein YlxM (UPF0122 family)